MLPLAVALLFRQSNAGALPKPAPATLPNEVRDWAGFKHLPAGPREVPKAFPAGGDWSGVKGDVAPKAVVWRTKVVILDRVDRVRERGPDFVWPGHHGLPPYIVERIKRALTQLRARVADLTKGRVNMVFDLAEEKEALTNDRDLPAVVARYLTPRINGGRYDAEDGLFRGPYQSVFVVHPVGGEASPDFEVQGTPTSLVGLPDLAGEEVDGALANDLTLLWQGQAVRRAVDAGAKVATGTTGTLEDVWPTVAKGLDATTEERSRMLGLQIPPTDELATGGDWSERGPETVAKLAKDPTRGTVLVVDELGAFREGGIALPTVRGAAFDASAHPTLALWAKSDAKDPIVLQLGSSDRSVWLGRDVPFAYDNAWHRVKLDLRGLGRIDRILVAPDPAARRRVRQTLGPIEASFSDFEASDEAPDPKPATEAPSAEAVDPEARARWAASAGPGEVRRKLLKDPVDAVRANATAAALARPDPADEPALVENALYTFEPAIFTPALRALAKSGTPTAAEALKQTLRIAAADRARGLAAELLAEKGDPKVVGSFIGLNQARTRAARIAAIRALARLPGQEAALMRMAYLAQDDPEVKLEATLAADPNDDAQARKLLWSAVNEPSDAVRLESLKRLARSNVPEFRDAGIKGVRDDSAGVRVGLLEAWTASPFAPSLPAIRVALTDDSPRVRAAALAALGANPAPVSASDVPFDDPDARVQLQALMLAAKKSIPIPRAARDRFRKSPDPALRAAAEGKGDL